MPIDYPERLAGLDLQPGASEAGIQRLMQCAGGPLPADYLDLLRFSDGAEGDAGPRFWLQVWSAREVVGSLQSTSGFNHAPGALLIASDGGGTVFAIDTRGGDPRAMRFVQFGLPVIDWENVEHSEPTLDAFLVYLRTAE